jgi:hypothetical protein
MLSRRWDCAPLEGSEAPQMSFFKPGQLVLDTAVVAGARVVHLGDTFSETLLKAAEADAQWQATRQAVLEESPNVAKQFEVHGEFLLFENCCVIPNNLEIRLAILAENHNSKVAGHFERHKTYERMTQNLYWSKWKTMSPTTLEVVIFVNEIELAVIRSTGYYNLLTFLIDHGTAFLWIL